MPPAGHRVRVVAGLLALLSIVALISAARIGTALTDPGFDTERAEGMLRSDPALLYYITQRIVESGGLPPDDFRADPNVQYPDAADLPAMFTVGQEFVVAWLHLAFGGNTPLHVFSVWVMGVFASLAAVGVYGLTYELTSRVRWAVMATLFYAVTPYNYRTIGFILIREDFSLPWFALHLYLLARAARLRSAPSFLWAGLALVLALASWHAMGFVVLLEVVVFFAWFLRTGENPFAVKHAWVLLACVAAGGLVVPVLLSKLFLLSLPMLLATAMWIASLLDRDASWTHGKRVAVALAGAAVLLAISIGVSRLFGGGQADYGHVLRFLLAKIAYVGMLPEDPGVLPFDVRLLWHGPFATASPADFVHGLAVACVLLAFGAIVAVPRWFQGRGDRALLLVAGFALVGVLSGWLVRRTLVLPGLITPVLAAMLFARLERRKLAVGLMVAALVAQTLAGYRFLDRHVVSWYANPGYNAEIAHLVRWVRDNLPPGECVAGDFVHSTALLAHHRTPIVCQPKYETTESRRRFEDFLSSYLKGTPDDLRSFAARYGCRYVLIDRVGLWTFNRYIAGIPPSQPYPAPGTAAAAFSSVFSGRLTGVPGFELVYRSPGELKTDLFRLYEVDP